MKSTVYILDIAFNGELSKEEKKAVSDAIETMLGEYRKEVTEKRLDISWTRGQFTDRQGHEKMAALLKSHLKELNPELWQYIEDGKVKQ